MIYEKYNKFLTRDGLLILLFHGIVKENNFTVRNYNRKHIFDFEFEALLRNMSLKGYPISMDEVVECYQEERDFPPCSFSVTFDDGFENNYSVAAPILADLRMPALFYVATEFIDKNLMSWIDQIDYCLEKTQVRNFNISLFNESVNVQNREEKINFLDRIREVFKKDKIVFSKRNLYIHEIFAACDVEYLDMNQGELDQKMTWLQLQELSANPLFTVGGHTHTHPIMSFLSDNEIDFEIDMSLGKIRDHLKQPIRHFSYPEGLQHCYNKTIIDKLKRKGIICAPSAVHGINTKDDDLFNLKRVSVI